MSDLLIGGSLNLKAEYQDSNGNPASPPPGAGQLTWSLSDVSVASLTAPTGETDTVTALATSAGLTTSLAVTDGVLTSDADVITLTQPVATKIVIVPA